MRKRDLQSFQLKLSDLKEYETVKAANNTAREAEKNAGRSIPVPDFKYYTQGGPKTNKEIRERIGLPME